VLPDEAANVSANAVNALSSADIVTILRERGWLSGEPSTAHLAWCAHAAAILGTQVSDKEALAELLGLVFQYNAREILGRADNQAVMSRYAAREVLRRLGLLLLEGGPLTSDRFKEIVDCLKTELDIRGRELFHPIRLALAGRSGEGDLDRVILLLDEAAALPFAVPVKSARERILEFCSALD
jgi:nondiscriminating glutamyl-tRNA synthetase